MLYYLRQQSTRTEEMLLRLLGIKRVRSPWGTALCLYSFFFFFFSPLLFIWIEPAICSVAPRSAIVSCLLLPSKKKKKKRKEKKRRGSAKHFKTVSLGARACRPGSKGKKLNFRSFAESWGNSEVKGQHKGSLIKNEREG